MTSLDYPINRFHLSIFSVLHFHQFLSLIFEYTTAERGKKKRHRHRFTHHQSISTEPHTTHIVIKYIFTIKIGKACPLDMRYHVSPHFSSLLFTKQKKEKERNVEEEQERQAAGMNLTPAELYITHYVSLFTNKSSQSSFFLITKAYGASVSNIIIIISLWHTRIDGRHETRAHIHIYIHTFIRLRSHRSQFEW